MENDDRSERDSGGLAGARPGGRRRLPSVLPAIVLALVVGAWLVGPVAASDTTGPSIERPATGEHQSVGDDWNTSIADEEEPTCERCHEVLSTDTAPRTLENEIEHQPDHAFELRHGEDMWCLDCHATENRSKLVMPNGTVTAWTTGNQIRQCAGCHGPVFEDWTDHVHGKWTGPWEDPVPAKTCTDCHDPHRPALQPIEPEPAPREPPAGPTVARSVLSSGYYATVGFVGIVATGLIGYAGFSLRREP